MTDVIERGAPGPLRGFLLSLGRGARFIIANQLILIGFIMTLLVVIVAVAAPLLATHSPTSTDPFNRLQPPSAENWMGTDGHGRDVYSRVVYGSQVSVRVGFAVLVLTTLGGGFLGVLAGYYRALDGLIMRFADALMAFPSILLAIAILAILGPREMTVIVALSITYMPRTARTARGSVLRIREMDYITATVSLGSRDSKVLLRHVVPNALSPIIVQATFTMAMAILAEAGLSYIGAGTQPPTASWGNMLSEGQIYMWNAPWLTIWPGAFIMVAVLGINLLGDGLRDYLDPRMRGM